MSAFVTVRRYGCAEEARVAWSLLCSAGIAAVLDHHETGSLFGPVADVVGVALRVPADEAEDCLAALAYVESGAFSLEEDSEAA